MRTIISTILATISVAALTACGGGIENQEISSNTVAIEAPVVDPVGPHNQPGEVGQLYGSGVSGTMAPKDMLLHYNVPAKLTGAGQVIAIVDAPGSIYGAAILADLNSYSTYYGLPQCNATNPCYRQIDLSNGLKLTASMSDWKNEVSLDVQTAHAMAPAATIVLVTAKSTAVLDMMAAVTAASQIPGVTTISCSWGLNEIYYEVGVLYDGLLASIQSKGIVVFASSGDSGNNGSNQQWPAASPYVTAVGGTTISTGYSMGNIANATEKAWKYGGGGASILENIPMYQKSFLLGSPVLTLNPTKRSIPDVAYNADPLTAPASVLVGGKWAYLGGTSMGAPQWAAIVALLAHDRAMTGATTMKSLVASTPGGFNGLLYQAKYAADFSDITDGGNYTGTKTCALCTASKGYDAVTGLGVPNVTLLAQSF